MHPSMPQVTVVDRRIREKSRKMMLWPKRQTEPKMCSLTL